MGQKNPWIWGMFGTAVLSTKNSFYRSASQNCRTTPYCSPGQPTSSTRGGGRGGGLEELGDKRHTQPSGPPCLPWQKLVPLRRQGAAHCQCAWDSSLQASLWVSGVCQWQPQSHSFGANSRKTTGFHVVLPSTINQEWLTDFTRTGVARPLLFSVSSGLRFLL